MYAHVAQLRRLEHVLMFEKLLNAKLGDAKFLAPGNFKGHFDMTLSVTRILESTEAKLVS